VQRLSTLDYKMSPSSKKILLVVTSPLTCSFYGGFLGYLQDAGIRATLVSSPGELLDQVASRHGAARVAVAMQREISPLRDLISLYQIFRTMKQQNPSLVDVSTPKAGLLGGVAGWLAGVPCRVYTLRGLRLETTTGLKRALLWATEWISCQCAHRVVCISPSLGSRVVDLKLVPANKTTVLANGSRGVDLVRFVPCDQKRFEADAIRERLGIAENELVIGFVGRLVKDKGIRELVQAFRRIKGTRANTRLLLIGDFEQGNPVEGRARRYIESDPEIIRLGFVADTAPYYAVMDIFALPTYREGFPGVALEAQASGVPVVTTNATGAIDSILDGVTGLLVPVGDSNSLAVAIDKLLGDPEARARMGRAGRERMERDFRPEVIWRAHLQVYRDLLQEKQGRSRNHSDSITSQTSRWAKRSFDLLTAIGLLLVLSPVLAAIAVVVRLLAGSPVLFRQRRPGLRGQLFTCLKFRTMTAAHDANGQLLPDGERLTPFGRFLRCTSLDELPELINVIRGEMSLVGPRPLLPKYLNRYSPEQMRRHEVKPGITGWAQINGRNALNWNRKFELDLWYVDHRSFWLDLKILATTAWKVLKCVGISTPGHATMPEFVGVNTEREQGNA
jgi:lipopolysaccharide/colanic/teichoic acid biosynthesis glycosyltransferase/glycosyltransferase involved in cell wall biosynthesis